MDQKKTSSRFGSNRFLTRKSESEDKSESSSADKSDWLSRLTVIENQNKEMIRRYEDMRRQNDKIIQQNETILEMLETQMKLFLDDKNQQMNNHQGAPTSSNPSDNVQSTCNSTQSLAVSNPLYKFNNTTTMTSNMKAKPDGAWCKVSESRSGVKTHHNEITKDWFSLWEVAASQSMRMDG